MKKSRILAGIFALMFFAVGSAQVHGQANISANQTGRFTIGGRIGGALGFSESLADIENLLRPFFSYQNARVSIEPELNFNVALYGNFAITNMISIQAELNVMNEQGYELLASRRERGSDSFDIEYTSLDIPLLLRFNFLRSQPMFGVMAGPHISIPIGRLEIYDNRAEAYIEELRIDSAFTFGLTAGLFAGFRAGPGRIMGDLRFIFDFDSLQAEGVEFSRRRAVAFTVGYEISF